MKVGIDAQMLCRSITGIERYAYEVIRPMLRLNPDVEFFLYAPLPITVNWGDAANLTIRTSNVKFRGGGILWSQTKLPYWAKQDKLDVLWVPTHRMPRLLPDNIARVVTIHDLVWKHAGDTMRPLNRLAERILMPDAIRLADRIVADSQCTADAIAETFPSARLKTRVVYLGATAFPQPNGVGALLDFGIDRPYFLFVGTLEPRKNLRRLLQAYAMLDPVFRGENILVIAGGKGWGNQDLALLIQTLGLEDSVRLTGYVNEEILATLYQHALFLAMPSLYEGFGLPLLEAMSFGVPVLTSSCSSMPEVAGDAGLLVDPLNVNSIAHGISRMLADGEYRNLLAGRTKKRAAQFSWENAAKEIMEIFCEAIHQRQAMR